MNFSAYSIEFRKAASYSGMTSEQIELSLSYAENLYKQGLPIIFDQLHLSLLVGYDYKFLLAISNDAKAFYKHYLIPKRNGGERVIDEPLPSLKEIQSWILSEILNPASKKMVSPVAKAFIRGKSLRDNARFHRGKEKVIALDIADFFHNIGYGAVYGIFQQMGYSKPVCVMLSRLCTLHGSLPQGAPTSPMLSNMFFMDADQKIFHYCRERKIQYTRYADDMIFSGNDIYTNHLISYVKMLLTSKHLELNASKTKVMGRGARQRVTGVVVNDKMQVQRGYRDKIRQEVYYITKYGLTSHWENIHRKLPAWINSPLLYLKHLMGKVYFVLQINPHDDDFLMYEKMLKIRLKEFSV